MHYCYLKQGVQEYLTLHFTNCMSHIARVLEKKIFTYQMKYVIHDFPFL